MGTYYRNISGKKKAEGMLIIGLFKNLKNSNIWSSVKGKFQNQFSKKCKQK